MVLDMSKLTIEEINQGIAEYMGVHPETFLTNNLKGYTQSLDALMPVLEKYCNEKFGSERNNKLMVVQLLAEIVTYSHSIMYMFGHDLKLAVATVMLDKIKELVR